MRVRTDPLSFALHVSRVDDVACLRAGDHVEVRHWETLRHHGVVDEVCSRLGVVWILEGPLRERTMVDAAECTLWRSSRHGGGR